MPKKTTLLEDFDGPSRDDEDWTDPLTRSLLPTSDVGAAWRLVAMHGKDLIYIVNRGWAVWDGRRFSLEDGDSEARRRAYNLPNIVYAEADAMEVSPAFVADDAPAKNQRRVKELRAFALRCNNTPKIKNALEEASNHPGVRRRIDQVDAYDHVFNAANGRIDLHALPPIDTEAVGPEDFKQAFGPHEHVDLATRVACADFDPEADCPLFEAFLKQIKPNPDTRAYLQNICGYSLSGSISAQAVFLFRGEGAKGKSTLINAINNILGD